METIYSLRLQVSKHLAGKVVQPESPSESLEVYLYEVAREKLKMKNDYVVPPGTKAFIKLSDDEAKKASVRQVSKWLASGKAVKGSYGNEEDILMALMRWSEK